MVAADKTKDQTALIACQSNGLDALFNRCMEILTDRFNGVAARGTYGMKLARSFLLAGQGFTFSLFHIGCIITRITVHNASFAACRDSHEFMGSIAANGAGVCFNRSVVEPAAVKDAGVGIIHLLIGLIKARFIRIEGIGILHDEFAASHEAEAGPLFITELALDLIKARRQLTVGMELILNEGGNHFFMRWAQAEFSAVAIPHTEHFRPIDIPTAAFLPPLGGLYNRHHDFLRIDGVHFLPDDAFNLLDAFPRQWKVGIKPASNLTDIASTQHQFVAFKDSFCRHFTKGRRIEF